MARCCVDREAEVLLLFCNRVERRRRPQAKACAIGDTRNDLVEASGSRFHAATRISRRPARISGLGPAWRRRRRRGQRLRRPIRALSGAGRTVVREARPARVKEAGPDSCRDRMRGIVGTHDSISDRGRSTMVDAGEVSCGETKASQGIPTDFQSPTCSVAGDAACDVVSCEGWRFRRWPHGMRRRSLGWVRARVRSRSDGGSA
jgi:hypothetical protein